MPEFHIGQELGESTVLDGSDSPNVDGIARPLATGGTSEIYLLRQPLGVAVEIRRALKVFKPSEKISERRKEIGLTEGHENFEKEIATIASFSHQNLVKIIGAGNVPQSGERYFVMELIEGPTLAHLLDPASQAFAEWSKRAKADPFLVLRMVRQLCWPLHYLHSSRFFHFDVAPKNVFVRLVNDKPHLILGDLGVGHTVPTLDQISEKDSAKTIFIAGTRKYTPPQLHEYLNRKEVGLGELSRFAVFWDVFAVATILEEAILAWGLEEHPDLIATQILCKRARVCEEGISALTFAEELERLLPAHVTTANVEELSSDAFGKSKYVQIPLYSVPLSTRVATITYHPLFTRLQTLPQLLLARSILPGGVHSKHEHALGAYALGRRYLIKLLSQPEFRATFSKGSLEESLLVALLCKVVSFPLDYVYYEMTSPSADEGRPQQRKKLVEMFFESRLRDEESLSHLVGRLFPNADLARVKRVLSRSIDREDESEKLMLSLIASSIDVRVVDYLARDSLHTGVPSGMGIDVGTIIDSLLWIPSKGLGISRQGVFSVEHLLCSRHWMFNRVYWNRYNRSFVSMLRYSLFGLIRRGSLTEDGFIKSMMHITEDDPLAEIEKFWHLAGEDYIHFPVVGDLRSARPTYYPQLLELSVHNFPSKLIHVAKSLNTEVAEEMREMFITNSTLRAKLTMRDLLFDFPPHVNLKLGEDIDVELSRGQTVTLAEASEVVASLPKAFSDSVFRIRVFFRPGLEEKLGSEVMKQLEEEVREFMTEKLTLLASELGDAKENH